ncbi:hypothetical protein EVAR_28484_1 [Eumeta japonica]|uniref:Uncharacterized protein n=1 Tax=Eumeta variegata TaxID=151549 RepID=A0A4C1WRF7_EUMVA|nr:hypothetical protein EVAR_28484_1 [Eumeta japonica]
MCSPDSSRQASRTLAVHPPTLQRYRSTEEARLPQFYLGSALTIALPRRVADAETSSTATVLSEKRRSDLI